MRLWVSLLIVLFMISCKPAEDGSNTLGETPQESKEDPEEEYFDSENFDLLVQQYEDPSRVQWQNPDFVVEKLGDLTDYIVADIGVGSGYFAFRVAEKAEKVIAIDTDQRFIDYIEEMKEEPAYEPIRDKVHTRLSLEDDPLLAPQEVHVVLMVNTYHFLSNRADYLRRVRSGIKRGGKIILVDFKKGSMPVGPPEELKVSREELIRDLTNAGFEGITSDVKSLQYQYIITAFNQ